MANQEWRMEKARALKLKNGASAPKRDIEERTFRFATRIVKLAQALPDTTAGRLFGKQILRSGTSVGANVHEAQDSPTKKDFTWRINVARCEARETLYWLKLMADTAMVPEKRLIDLRNEADELVRILTAIVKKARSTTGEERGVRKAIIRHS
jgi:four helix bundle protein